MTRRLYLLANEQTVSSLLLFARNSVGMDQCQSHLFLRYNWHNSDLEKEVDFSKSFECLITVLNNCRYSNLKNVFRYCSFDADTSCETGFITFKKGNEYTFTFAFILDEIKNKPKYLLRISGKVNKSLSAMDNGLLAYLLSLGI